MTVFRKVERFGNPETSRTPMEKAVDPDLGYDLIPAERYTSTAFMAREWDRLWTRAWLMGAWEGDLRNPGDYVVTQIGTESIVITKDENHQYNAFYNVCSHRGNQIAYGGCGHVETFKCSYHLWEYNMRGELINVPDVETFPQGVSRDRLSIRRIACESWGGWVWINMNPDAEPLADYLGMIPQHLDPYHFDRMALVNDITVEWDCNWKASVDAFNEAYHVAGTHPQLMSWLEDMDVQIDVYERHSRYLIPFGTVSSHIADGTTISDGMKGYMASYGMDPERFQGTGLDVRRAIQRHLRENGAAMGFDFSELNDDQLSDDYHYMIFPNITMNIHCNSVMIFRQRPHESDPNKMYWDLQNYSLIPEGEPWPERPVHRQFKHGEESLGEVLDQDAMNLPMIQKGMNSRGFRGLWVGTQELRVRHFHKTIDDYLFRESAKWVK
ncbi:MAG: aromatic ring-hydroxylating oxygenase subunit alpha [Gammaproteobacteria bacterium]